MSNSVYKNLNIFIKIYKENLNKINKCVKKAKNLGASDQEINNIVKLLIEINIDKKDLNTILSKYPNNFKKIIVDLNEFLPPFINNDIEVLKQNLDFLFNKVNEKKFFCVESIKVCQNHTHYLPLCWITIKKFEWIFKNKKIN
ncbi:MAG: hypothetical protein REH79_03415 [Spiroplasma sp.]|nr:hypothetical protein [Spiroplasma sp.]